MEVWNFGIDKMLVNFDVDYRKRSNIDKWYDWNFDIYDSGLGLLIEYF